MSYEVANRDKSLGQFASNKGFTDLKKKCAGYTAIRGFFREGVTTQVAQVVKELGEFAMANSGTEEAHTALTLAGLIDGQTVAVITDGVHTEARD